MTSTVCCSATCSSVLHSKDRVTLYVLVCCSVGIWCGIATLNVLCDVYWVTRPQSLEGPHLEVALSWPSIW
jgi:hypothetical protein